MITAGNEVCKRATVLNYMPLEKTDTRNLERERLQKFTKGDVTREKVSTINGH
jgi:hypothetical protein